MMSHTGDSDVLPLHYTTLQGASGSEKKGHGKENRSVSSIKVIQEETMQPSRVEEKALHRSRRMITVKILKRVLVLDLFRLSVVSTPTAVI